MAEDDTQPQEQDQPAATEPPADTPEPTAAAAEPPADADAAAEPDAAVEPPADTPEPDAAPEAAAAAEPPAATPQPDAAPEAAAAATPEEQTPPQAQTEAAEQPPSDAAQADSPAGEETVASGEDAPAPAVIPTVAAEDDSEQDAPPRVKPAVPGADLEVDIVPEGVDPLAREGEHDPYALEDEEGSSGPPEERDELSQPIATATIDLGADARYKATGKRKTAIARVILRPGSGAYQVNGRTLEQHFPRATLQRNIRQPLETVGYEVRMDVVARLQGGGISAQAGALRHGISRALLEADPNLRGELKRRGFLTRDSRAKERKKAGLKKARKRPQFSKR